MSRALAVFHGRFGRATVYQLNRPFSTYAHREGRLIFHVAGTPGRIRVGEEKHCLAGDAVIAVNPGRHTIFCRPTSTAGRCSSCSM